MRSAYLYLSKSPGFLLDKDAAQQQDTLPHQYKSGRDAPSRREPSPQGGGGSPPRPVKMIKTAGKLRGKINT